MQSNSRAMILSRPAVFATMVIAFALVVASTVLSAVSTRNISAADGRAEHAQQSVVVINQLLTTMTAAETAERGYVLTRDPKYLAPYEAAGPKYRHELSLLERQFAGAPAQAALVRRIAQLCAARFADIARTIQLRREHGIAPALNVVESDEGWRAMNGLRDLLDSLQRQELDEIAAHTALAAREARFFQTLNRGLLALAALLAGAVAWVIARRLHNLEGLIKVCAWTQRVQWKGQWISFEEYLAKRFNLHCTHGISDEAALKLGREIENTPVPEDIPNQPLA